MTQKTINRVDVLMKVDQKQLKQAQAATELGLSPRQVRRLYKLYKTKGITALASQRHGKASNNKLPELTRARASEIVTSPLYAGFGPTLMTEKLEELHNIKISHETTRQLMIQNEVWSTDKKKRPVIHQQRQRRARFGELVQIDGSPHAWFEDRGEECDLLVFIDDATGRTHGRFCESETTAGYMQTTLEYIEKYGKPLAFYSDKHSIFRINHGQGTKRENFTQFGRALHELDIELIYANSPQAKGRVEKANRTLQDRLIKEMRLAGIRSIEEGNRFLETWWEKFNEKFSIQSLSLEDAHRKVDAGVDLRRILCEKHERKISKNLEFQFENVIYQVVVEKPSKSLIGATVTAIEGLDGSLSFECKGERLQVKRYDEQMSAGPELSRKELDQHFRRSKGHKVPRNHPWLQVGRAEACMREYMRT